MANSQCLPAGWSKEKLVALLISLVKDKPQLWDNNKNKSQIGFEQRNLLWEQIAAQLGIHARAAKSTWIYLRNSFCREWKRSKDAEEAGQSYKSPWIFYEDLLFLKDCVSFYPPYPADPEIVIKNEQEDGCSDEESNKSSSCSEPEICSVKQPTINTKGDNIDPRSLCQTNYSQPTQYCANNNPPVVQASYPQPSLYQQANHVNPVPSQMSTFAQQQASRVYPVPLQMPTFAQQQASHVFPVASPMSTLAQQQASHVYPVPPQMSTLAQSVPPQPSFVMNDDYHFLMSILPSLQKFKPERKTAVKLRILHSIFEGEQIMYRPH